METFWLFDTYSTQVMKDCAEYLKLLKTIGAPEVCFRKKRRQVLWVKSYFRKRHLKVLHFIFILFSSLWWESLMLDCLLSPCNSKLCWPPGFSSIVTFKKKICSKWMVNQKSFWVKVNLMYWTWLKKMCKCRGKSPVTPKGVCQHRHFKWPFPSVILHLQINSIDLISKIQMVNSVQATEIR